MLTLPICQILLMEDSVDVREGVLALILGLGIQMERNSTRIV